MGLRQYAAAGGVVIEDGMMLLLDRPQRVEVRLPKGHVEPGETPEETALREVCEETGLADLEIAADLGERLVEFDYQGDHYRRTERYFLMRKTGERTVARSKKDAADFQPVWTPIAQAAARLTYAAERDVAVRAILLYRDAEAPGRDGDV